MVLSSIGPSVPQLSTMDFSENTTRCGKFFQKIFLALIANIVSALRKSSKNFMRGYRQDYQSGKQGICTHKCSKLISGGHAGNQFLLVGGSRPQTLFAEFYSAATHRSGAFPPAPGGDFLKTARLAYQHNRNLLCKGKRHFSKSVRLAEPQPA